MLREVAEIPMLNLLPLFHLLNEVGVQSDRRFDDTGWHDLVKLWQRVGVSIWKKFLRYAENA